MSDSVVQPGRLRAQGILESEKRNEKVEAVLKAIQARTKCGSAVGDRRHGTDGEPKSRASAGKKGHTELYRGADTSSTSCPKSKSSRRRRPLVERAIEAIIKAARTGKIGDGKIFVTSVEQAVRIRTGESGEAAV
jgi:nitrogen regulatory protein PII